MAYVSCPVAPTKQLCVWIFSYLRAYVVASLFLYVRTYVWFVFVFCVSVYSCVRTYVCALRMSLRFAWGLWSVFLELTGFDCWGDRWCSVLSSKRTHRDPFTDLSRRRRYVDGEIDCSIGSRVRAYVRT